ncbi:MULTISPECIES: hypothetical protein [Streptomyces]|nr:hypothetical protein [Streptomyces sp. LRE541]UPZ26486.1 hypothetical protein MUK60_00895 [Streptomyces sp. LRE541]
MFETHDRAGITRAERSQPHGRLLSGYSLHDSRALGLLATALLVTVV